MPLSSPTNQTLGCMHHHMDWSISQGEAITTSLFFGCFVQLHRLFSNFWPAAAASRIPCILPPTHVHASAHARSFSLIFERDKILMTLLGNLGIFSYFAGRQNNRHISDTRRGGGRWMFDPHPPPPPPELPGGSGCKMTKAGQIGKPHPAGTEEGRLGQLKGCRASNGRNRWVNVCVLAGFFLCKVMIG